ncbi:hypothetical protein SUGI_0074480 [Cryptomeria japonica]|nr:hypothetical protein SUGI_0074480 [Cryptomeria japonica]
MELNLQLVLVDDNKLIAFSGEVKHERWRRITNDLDDLASRALREIMGEELIYNEFRFGNRKLDIARKIDFLLKWLHTRATPETYGREWGGLRKKDNASKKKTTSAKDDAGPSSFAVVNVDCDYVDQSLMEE